MKPRQDLKGHKLPAEIRLKCLKVSQKTLDRYQSSVAVFEAWATQHKRRLREETLDRHVTAYLTELHEQKQPISTGTYLVYGLQLLRCKQNKQDFLVGAKEALAGWRKGEPGRMKLPVPEEFIYDLASEAIDQGRTDIAVVMALQLDGYMRPSEVLNLTSHHITPPAGRRYAKWGVIIAPSGLGQTTKVGKSDDSIILGDLKHNSWIGDVLRLYTRNRGTFLFESLGLQEYEQWCKQT